MDRLHIAFVNLDRHCLRNRNTQFLADGRFRIRQKSLPESVVQRRLLNDLLQHLLATLHSFNLEFSLEQRFETIILQISGQFNRDSAHGLMPNSGVRQHNSC